HREGELLARLQIQRHAQLAGADSGSLCIHHDANESLAGRCRRADVSDYAARPIMRGVRHVQSENVHAGVDQLADHFRGIGRWAQSGDDFSFARRAGIHWGRILTAPAGVERSGALYDVATYSAAIVETLFSGVCG